MTPYFHDTDPTVLLPSDGSDRCLFRVKRPSTVDVVLELPDIALLVFDPRSLNGQQLQRRRAWDHDFFCLLTDEDGVLPRLAAKHRNARHFGGALDKSVEVNDRVGIVHYGAQCDGVGGLQVTVAQVHTVFERTVGFQLAVDAPVLRYVLHDGLTSAGSSGALMVDQFGSAAALHCFGNEARQHGVALLLDGYIQRILRVFHFLAQLWLMQRADYSAALSQKGPKADRKRMAAQRCLALNALKEDEAYVDFNRCPMEFIDEHGSVYQLSWPFIWERFRRRSL